MVSQGHITYTVGHSVQCSLHCSWAGTFLKKSFKSEQVDLTGSPGNSNTWLTDMYLGNIRISFYKFQSFHYNDYMAFML